MRLSRTRVTVVLVAALAGMFAFTATARAHEGESDDAKVLVLQAIALIVNTPDDHMEIEEHLEAALEARNTEGVDMTHVRHAAAAYEAGDLRHTRDYLQSAIGAGPYVSNAEPQRIREGSGQPGQPAYAVGGESGTLVVLDTYRPDPGLNGGDLAVLLASIAALLGGGLLAWRYRPADTVRRLRHAADEEGDV